MQTNSITYQTKTATKNDVLLHLNLCNDEFIPKLNSRVNIEEYATKISQYAITFEAWNKQQLIGLIASYFNQENHFGFITNVSVLKENMGTGVASELIEMCIKYASINNYEVRPDILLSNIDQNGNKIWSKIFGSSKDDIAQNMLLDANENIIITGHTTSDLYTPAIFIVKVDKNGNYY